MWWNLIRINKTYVREYNDLYWVGFILGIDDWVDRETIELLVYEYENGVREM